jgi:acyl-CoA thioesterase I
MKLRALLPLLIVCLLASCSRDTPRLQPLAADAVILAFGDSLTYGSGVGDDNSYPAVLTRLSGHTVINAGIPGERSTQGLARLPGELDEYQPALLILCHGGNDMLRKQSMETMQANLEQMIQLAKGRGVQVILLGVPQPALFGLDSAKYYRLVADKMGIPLQESVIPEVLSDTRFKSDQIHPNAAGYEMMAEAVYRLLVKEGAL